MNRSLDGATKELKRKEVETLERQFCCESLKYLCVQMLGMSDWDVCHDELEDFLKNSAKNKKLILLPREHLKTSVLTIGLSIQHLLRNPDLSILIINAVQGNAESIFREIRQYLTTHSPLPRLFGTFESWKWNETEGIIKQRVKADKTPSYAVAGADKALASQHYDVIFADDIVNRQTVSTHDQIEKTRNLYSDMLDLLKKPDGVLYVIGTRWDSSDIYGAIMDDFAEDFDILNMQATRDGTLTGECIFPKKFNEKVLKELLREKGSWDFYLQYMNSVVNVGNRIFDPPIRRWERIPGKSMHCVTVDPAISKKDDSCDAVVLDSCINPANQLCVVEYAVFKGENKHPSRIIEKTLEYVNRFGADVVGIESNGYQEVLCVLLEDEMRKRRMSFQVVSIRQNEDKARRIIGLQPYWERGDLLLKEGMVELERQFDEFRKPLTGKVDILDALAMRLQLDIGQSFVESRAILPERFRNSDYFVDNGFKKFWKHGAYVPEPVATEMM